MKSLANWENPLLTDASWMPRFSSMIENFFSPEYNSLFDSVQKGTTVPAVNVSQTDTLYTVEMAAPGMKKEDFKVEVEGNVLAISCEKEAKKEEKEQTYTRREYSYNAFSRSFLLPKGVQTDTIKAQYTDGVLKIELPKTELEKKKANKVIAIS